MARSGRGLPVIVGRRPRILFVGINPSLRSAEVGHHFASPGNPFWRLLHAARLIPHPFSYADDARLFDLVGEFGNMVCGSWLTRSCQRRRFDLQHPIVVRSAAAEAPAQGEGLSLALNGQPVFVRLGFAEA